LNVLQAATVPFSNPVMNQRYHNLQVLRIFGAGIIVICHLNYHAGRALGLHSPVLQWVYDYLCSFAVSAFFSMSGFVLANSLHSTTARQFIKARLLRIFPAYWAAVVIVVLLERSPGLRWFSDPKAWAGLLLVPAGADHAAYRLGIEWTLVFEVFFYAAFGLMIVIHRRLGPTVGVILWLAAIVTAIAVRPAGPYQHLPNWSEIALSPLVVPLLLGALAVHLKPYGRIVRLVAPVAAPGLFFACRLIPRWEVAMLVAGLSSALVVAWAAAARQIADDHPLVTFGGWSYGVYLVHVPVLTAVLDFGVRHGWGATGMDLVAVAGFAALGVGLIYGSCEAAVYRRLRCWLVRRPPAPAILPFPSHAVSTESRAAA
jgi:peptidoglycan/LPS O-acetylase OafA/YrhL